MMFGSNPFALIAEDVPAVVMQGYVVLMALLVAVGTLVDMLHKRSAEFFFLDWRRSRAAARRVLGAGERVALALRTLLYEVLSAGEFCNPARRISHLLMFYGFIFYVVATVVMVFGYTAPMTATPPLWPILWHLGALMVLVGGYWFFFFIRVDVAHEGRSPWRLRRADLFIGTLLASVTFALIWAFMLLARYTTAAWVFFALYVLFTTLLFASVPWSKFAHMFYKPVAAFQKRVQEAEGSSTLPQPTTSGGGRCPPSRT
jgi:hypothetical protein